MRPGLVLIGAILAVIGLLVIVIALLSFGGAVSDTTTLSSSPFVVHTQEWIVQPIPGRNGSGGPLQVQVAATQPLNVYLSTCPPPSGARPPASCTVASTGEPQSSANLSTPGPLTFPYYVTLENPSPYLKSTVLFSGKYSYMVGGLPEWESLVLVAGGLILAVGGGLAFFLGIFLRGNPFRPPPGKAPQSPGSGGSTPPEHEPTREPPPRG
jgi:hypothetical protein